MKWINVFLITAFESSLKSLRLYSRLQPLPIHLLLLLYLLLYLLLLDAFIDLGRGLLVGLKQTDDTGLLRVQDVSIFVSNNQVQPQDPGVWEEGFKLNKGENKQVEVKEAAEQRSGERINPPLQRTPYRCRKCRVVFSDRLTCCRNQSWRWLSASALWIHRWAESQTGAEISTPSVPTSVSPPDVHAALYWPGHTQREEVTLRTTLTHWQTHTLGMIFFFFYHIELLPYAPPLPQSGGHLLHQGHLHRRHHFLISRVTHTQTSQQWLTETLPASDGGNSSLTLVF